MFGQRIREMYSDEWAFSGKLGTQCLSQNVWNNEAIRERPEAWMALVAITSGMKCCQSFLGPKLPPASGTGPSFVDAVRQTVASLFWCLENFQSYWMEHKGSEPVSTFGPEHDWTAEEKAPNPEQSLEMFRKGVAELESVLGSIVTRETLSQIKRIADAEPGKFRFSAELWVRTVYEFALAYHRAVIARDHVVQALVPLYRGKMYSFFVEHTDSSAEGLEADCEALCLEFERQKLYLVEKWKAKS
jgi:glucosylglycerate synthase